MRDTLAQEGCSSLEEGIDVVSTNIAVIAHLNIGFSQQLKEYYMQRNDTKIHKF